MSIELSEKDSHVEFSQIKMTDSKFEISVQGQVDYKFTLHNIRGEVLYQLGGTGPLMKKINLKEKGIYFLRLTTNNRITEKKIINF